MACGMVFRTRAHQVECEEAPADPRIVHMAGLLSTQYTDQQLERMRKEHEQRD